MNRITIRSIVNPITYIQTNITEKFFYIFIQNCGLFDKLDQNSLYIIYEQYIQIESIYDIKSNIFLINNQKCVNNLNIYKIKYDVRTCFRISNEKKQYKNRYLYEPVYNIINNFLGTFYVEKMNNCNIDRKVMKQIFRFKCGNFSILSDKIMEIIFEELIKMDQYYEFIYINLFSENKKYKKYKKYIDMFYLQKRIELMNNECINKIIGENIDESIGENIDE